MGYSANKAFRRLLSEALKVAEESLALFREAFFDGF